MAVLLWPCSRCILSPPPLVSFVFSVPLAARPLSPPPCEYDTATNPSPPQSPPFRPAAVFLRPFFCVL